MDIRMIADQVYDSLERNNFRTFGMPEAAMYDRPAIGVAAGDDPYFNAY